MAVDESVSAAELAAEVAVTGEDWDAKADALEQRAAAAQRAVEDVLQGQHPALAEAFTSSKNAQEEVRRLQGEVLAAVAEASSPESFQGVETVYLSERNRIVAHLEDLQASVEKLTKLQGLEAALNGIDEALEVGKLEEAGEAVAGAKKGFEEFVKEDEEFAASKTCTALRVLVRRKMAQVQAAAHDILENSLVVRDEKVEIHAFKGRFHIANALGTLEHLGMLSNYLKSTLGPALQSCILRPLAKHPNYKVHWSNGELQHSFEIRLPISSSSPHDDDDDEDEEDDLVVEKTLEHVLEAFRFINSHIIGENAGWMNVLEDVVWVDGEDGLGIALVDILKASMPEDPDALSRFQSLAESAKDLEDFLVEMGLVSEKNTVLKAFLGDLSGKHVEKRREHYLKYVRDLIVNDYRSNESATKEDLSSELAPLLKAFQQISEEEEGIGIPEMRVTLCAKETIRLAYRAFEEISKMPDDAGARVFETGRDCFDLFRIVVPIVHKDVLLSKQDSEMALLFHNDLLLMAQHLLIMGFIFRSRLPRKIERSFLTVDMVPQFRKLAAEFLGKQVDLQSDRIIQKVLRLDDGGRQVVMQFAQCLKICSGELKKLSLSWSCILGRATCVNAVGKVMDVVIKATVELLTKEIAEKRRALEGTIMSPHDITALRDALQNFKSSVESQLKMISPKSIQISDFVPAALLLSQISPVLEPYMTLHILKDNIEGGNLSKLSESQRQGIAMLLFPNEK